MAAINPLSGGSQVPSNSGTPAAASGAPGESFQAGGAASDPTGGMAGLAKTLGFSSTPGSADASQLQQAAHSLASQTAETAGDGAAAFA